MDYITLTFMPEMDAAREVLKFIQVNGIDSYIENKTNDENNPIVNQWVVMVRSKNFNNAKKLLSQFKELKQQVTVVKKDVIAELAEQQDYIDCDAFAGIFEAEDNEQELFAMEDDEVIPPLPYEEPYSTSTQTYFNNVDYEKPSAFAIVKSIIVVVLFINLCIKTWHLCQHYYSQTDQQHIEYYHGTPFDKCQSFDNKLSNIQVGDTSYYCLTK